MIRFETKAAMEIKFASTIAMAESQILGIPLNEGTYESGHADSTGRE